MPISGVLERRTVPKSLFHWTSHSFSPASISGLVALFDGRSGAYQDAARTTPAAAHWDAFGGWTDLSGLGNHATQATGGNKPSLQAGDLAYYGGKPSPRFDGTNSRLDIPDANNLDLSGSSFTIAAVLRMTTANSFACVLEKGSGSNGTVDYIIQCDSAGTKLRLLTRAVATIAVCNTALQLGRPYIVFFVQDVTGATAKIFLEDTEDATIALSGSATTNANPLRIGQRGNGTQGWKGEIPFVGIWNKAFSSTEREQLRVYLAAAFNLPTVAEAQYLGAFNGEGSGSYKIGVAVGNSPYGMRKYPANPVLTVGAGGTFDDIFIKDPCLLKVGSTYYLYYSGWDGAAWAGIGLATSTDRVTWAKSGSNPVLTGTAATWDSGGPIFPWVVYDAGDADATRRWKMWYQSGSSIGYAYSSDGLAWTKYASNPVIQVGAGGTYDDVNCEMGCAIKQGATWYLFYAGRPNGSSPLGDALCLATFANPESTPYTKSASNPLLAPRGTSVRVVALTADTAIGDHLVSVADTSGFLVNEPVSLRNTGGGGAEEDNRIAALVSSTQLSLVHPLRTAYTTALVGVISSALSSGISIRSILSDPSGGWLITGAYFDHLNTLREQSGSMAAPALTGPWTFSVDRGLLFPLGPAGDWDNVSAENASVILA